MKNIIRNSAILLSGILLIFITFSCSNLFKSKNKMDIKKELFGKTPDGKQVFLYTLTNIKGMTVKITNFGGIITSIIVPDKKGDMGDVVLGFDSLAPYFINNPHFGAIIGRYGNRIAKAKFSIDGKEYHLVANDNQNTLHGGINGFDKHVWDAIEIKDTAGVGLQLTYVSKDGEEGFPGNLKTIVTYTLTNNNELKINYQAETDKPTVLNLTHHSYFNLACHGDVLKHQIQINADRYVIVDTNLIPTGELPSVKGSKYDFIQMMEIGSRIDTGFHKGYDHCYVLNGKPGEMVEAATVYDPFSGRTLTVYTDQPGVQFYTGNFLDGSLQGKNEMVYDDHNGFCLETQHFPDSPNHPQFPSTLLRPGEKFHSQTIYKFGTK